jgi:hypothetical protein
MRLLPPEDVHLIVAVDERLHTAKVSAMVEDVSRHVQPLIAAFAKTSTPKSGPDIMNLLLDKHMSASTLSSSPVLPITAPVAAAVKTETIVEANHAPVKPAFDPETMRKALEDVVYDRAVAGISSANGEEAFRTIVMCASDRCQPRPSRWYPLHGGSCTLLRIAALAKFYSRARPPTSFRDARASMDLKANYFTPREAQVAILVIACNLKFSNGGSFSPGAVHTNPLQPLQTIRQGSLRPDGVLAQGCRL